MNISGALKRARVITARHLGVMMSMGEAKHVVCLDRALTLPAAEPVKASLLAALQGDAKIVEVDCANATEIDVSFIQIMLAARRQAAAEGKSLKLSAPAAGALRDALERGGFIGAADPDETKFWSCDGDAA